MTLKLGVRRIILPADELQLRGIPERYLILGDDVGFSVVLPYGIGPNVPRLLQTDDAGRLRVLQDLAAALSPMNLTQLGGQVLGAGPLTPADNLAIGASVIPVLAVVEGFDGVNTSRLRIASLTSLGTTNAIDALMTTPPGEWGINATPAANVVATITRAAVPGVRHLCRSITATLFDTAGIAAGVSGQVVLRDGVSGVGAILWAASLQLGPALGAVDRVALSGLNIVGGVNAAMTLEFLAAGGLNTGETVSLTGFDVSN